MLRPDGLKIPKKRAQRAPKEARTKGTGPKGHRGQGPKGPRVQRARAKVYNLLPAKEIL